MGRPSKYKPEFVEQARKLCLLGAKDAELAEFFEVQESTLNGWKVKHPEFMEALKAGKRQADAEVATRLYRRAMGYEVEAVKVFQFQGQPVIVPVVEKYPPDTTAAIFWLKNRQPEAWRDKREVENHNIDYVVSGEPVSDEEWEAEYAASLEPAAGSTESTH